MEKMKMQTPDGVEMNLDRIVQFFPGCITETRDEKGIVKRAVDFDLLRQELSGDVVEGPVERYQLNWPGKRQAVAAANAPINKTLRPCEKESVNFDTTGNLYIEGDNLDALKLLQETYLGKVKMIYIDPPYNTGNDFIYKDNFTADKEEYDQESGQRNEEGGRLVANPETNGRFHSDWLSMMLPRLRLAKNFLREDGVIFISIDDNEVSNLRKLCDEIFGADNFIGQFVINSSPSAIDYGHIAKMHDYVLFYARDLEKTTTEQLTEEDKSFKYSDEIGPFNIYPLYNGNVAFNPRTRPNLYYPFYLNPSSKIENDFYEIGMEKKDGWVEVYPVISRKDNVQRVWRWGRDKARQDLNKEIIGYKNEDGEYRVVQKTRHTGKVIRSLQLDKEISTRRGTADVEALFGKKVFSFPKSVELIRRFVAVSTDRDSIVFDFFAGSATTAHAVLAQNVKDQGSRRYILVQLPERLDPEIDEQKNAADYCDQIGKPRNIAELTKERIRRAGQKIKEENATNAPNLDIGFRVLKVDSSNMKDVWYTPDQLKQHEVELFTAHIKEDRTAEDLLFQIMLDWGSPTLDAKIRTEKVGGKTVFIVNDNDILACFEEGITEKLVKQMAAFKPLRAVFRDDAFDDSLKINVEQIFKVLSPGTEVKSI